MILDVTNTDNRKKISRYKKYVKLYKIYIKIIVLKTIKIHEGNNMWRKLANKISKA